MSDAALFLVDRISGVGTGVEPATVGGEAGHLAGVRGRRPNETPKACSFILSPLLKAASDQVSDAALFLVDRISGVGTGVEPATVDGEAGQLAGVRGRRRARSSCPRDSHSPRVTETLGFVVRDGPPATPSWPIGRPCRKGARRVDRLERESTGRLNTLGLYSLSMPRDRVVHGFCLRLLSRGGRSPTPSPAVASSCRRPFGVVSVVDHGHRRVDARQVVVKLALQLGDNIGHVTM